MKHNSTTKLLVTAVSSFALLAIATPAEAGRGGSNGAIEGAVYNGGSDAIVAQIEKAEKLVCPECVPTVLALTQDDRYEVREAAGWWLSKRHSLIKVVAQDAETTLASTTDTILARNAADLLGAVEHPRAIFTLNAAINRTDLGAEARVAVVRALGNIGHDAAVPGIEVALADTDATVRLAAVAAWSQIRFISDATPVVALIDDSDVAVRRAAIAVIGSFSDASARTALETTVISDDDAAVRRNAAYALGQIGDADSRSVLEQAVTDSSPLVRNTAKAAIRALR